METEMLFEKQIPENFIVERDIHKVNLPSRTVINRSNFQGPTGVLQTYQAELEGLPLQFEVPAPLSSSDGLPALLDVDLNSIPQTADELEPFLKNNLRTIQRLKCGRNCATKLLQCVRNLERALNSRLPRASAELLGQRYCLLNCLLFGTKQMGEGGWNMQVLQDVLGDVEKFQRGCLVSPHILNSIRQGFSFILDKYPKNANYEQLAALADKNCMPRYDSLKTKYVNFKRNCRQFPDLENRYWELRNLFLKFLYSGKFSSSEEHRFNFLYAASKGDFNKLLLGLQTKNRS